MNDTLTTNYTDLFIVTDEYIIKTWHGDGAGNNVYENSSCLLSNPNTLLLSAMA